MTSILTGIAMTGLGHGGLWCLAVAMKRHHQQVWGVDGRLSRKRLFAIVGSLTLLTAAVTSVIVWGFGLGLVTYFGVLTLAGLVVSMALRSLPAWTPPLAAAALAGGALAAFAVLTA
ncbi:DUF3325 domain-containing protein [Thioalkalivibrio sp. ALJ15]|uniref:DUF3325 domain-containing protein n=1 Tax=Thioalkalivibrio sp. ALJ15 TaxID=748652 RepID=UPI00035C3EAF|nr:DUF3325 domain-containing protein [Thioalkalivibrio sp. ALJ15]